MCSQKHKSIFSMPTPKLITYHNELAAERGVPQIETWTGDRALLRQGVTLLRMVEPKAAPEPLSIRPRA